MTRLSILALAAALPLAACGQPAAQGPSAEALLAELPAPYNAGRPSEGKKVFLQCTACHTVTKGGADMVGPNLFGLFGTKAGHRSDRFSYSEALKATGWTWDAATLDTWLKDPRAALPQTKMVMVGIPDAQQRADLIAYLKVASSGGPS